MGVRGQFIILCVKSAVSLRRLKVTNMETKFNSQICTTKEQSERLLALGLKKETADMFWWDNGYCSCTVISRPAEKEDGEYGKVIPAWSLHRLLCLYNCHYLEFMGEEEIASAYDVVIEAIESAITGGYFNKEYLCEKN